MKKKSRQTTEETPKTRQDKKISSKERNSSIELLRIIAMLMIVFHHFALHTPWQNLTRGTFEWYWITILKSFGKVGVAIFFIITGFFMQQKEQTQENSKKKILSIYGKTLFYSLACLIFAIIIGIVNAKSITFPLDSEILGSFLPFFSDGYWFVGDFIVITFLTPFLAKMLKKLKRKKIKTLLIAYFVFNFGAKIYNYALTGKYLGIFPIAESLIYVIIGYYLSKKRKTIKRKFKTNIILLASSLSIILIAPLFFNYITRFGYKYGGDYIWSIDSAVCALLAISLFCIFYKIKLKSRMINKISSLTFGVYLIHDNDFVRKWIWAQNPFYNIPGLIHKRKIFLVLFSILIPIIIFSSSAIIEALRNHLAKILSQILLLSKSRISSRIKK